MQAGPGRAFVQEGEQRPQIAQVRATGVCRAKALQLQEVVELVEDRLHHPTVADAGGRDSGDAPQGVRSEIIQ